MSLKYIVNLMRVVIVITIFLFGMVVANADAQLESEESDEMMVFVKEVVFTGNTVISTETLKNVAAPYMNKELTLEEMSELIDLVTITYQEQGYILARAFLPEQDIMDGFLQIGVVEGNIGKIMISGKTHYDDNVIKRYFKQQEKHGVIKESYLEKGLLLTNEMKKVKTDVVLKEGAKPGEVDLILNTKDYSELTFGVDISFDYNNTGSEYVSQNRFGTSIEFIDQRWGSTFNFYGSLGDRTFEDFGRTPLGMFSLKIPINTYGTELSLKYLNSSYIVKEEYTGDQYAMEGSTEDTGFGIIQPILIKKNQKLSLEANYEHHHRDTEVFGQLSLDKIDLCNITLNFDNIDRYLGKNIAFLMFRWGNIDITDGLPDTIRGEGTGDEFVDSDFEILKADFVRIQKVYGYTNFMFRASGQYTEDVIPYSEMMSIGGFGSVRGFDPAIYQGDSGYSVSGELMIAPPFISDKMLYGQRIAQLIQFALFYDHAGVYNNTPPESGEFESEKLSGYGAGFRLFYKDLLTFKYDIGFPIDKIENADDIYNYFQFNINFF